MSPPARSSGVRLRLVFFLAVHLTIAGSLKDDEVEVVTLGALHPPLVSQVRPSGGRKHAEAPLDRDETPDQAIARLMRHMFDRESQQFLQGQELEDLNTEKPPASSSPTAAADAADANAAATAEAQRGIRADGSRVLVEQETERHLPGSVDAAEAGQEQPQQPQQQQQPPQEDKGRLGISSTSGVDVPPQGLVGVVDSDSEDDGGRVEAGAAGVVSNAAGVGRVEGDGDDEEAGGGASTAARGARHVPARYALLEDPEDPFVEPSARHARRKETPDDPAAAVAAGSGAAGAPREMSVGQSPNGGLEAAVGVAGEGGEYKAAGAGALAELDEDDGVPQEQQTAAGGAESTASETAIPTDVGTEGGEAGSGDDRGTAAHAVGGLGTKLEERVAVEDELEVGADSSLSHGTSPTVLPDVDGQPLTAVAAEEGEGIADTAPTATAKDAAAAAAEAEAEAEAEAAAAAAAEAAAAAAAEAEAEAEADAAAEGTSADEAVAVPGVELAAGPGDLADDAPELPSDTIFDEEMGGATTIGEAPSRDADGEEDEGTEREDAAPAAGVPPATAGAAEGVGNEEQKDSADPVEEAGVSEPSGDSDTIRDAESPPRGDGGDGPAASVEAEGEVGLGGRRSGESRATEGGGAEFRPPEDEGAVPAGEEATDDGGIVESSPPPSGPRTARPAADALTEAPRAAAGGREASAAVGDRGASGEEGAEPPPRPRPVFRFSEPLPPAPQVADHDLVGKFITKLVRYAGDDGGVIDVAPLPPIEALSPGLGAEDNGGADDAAEGGSGGGWWAAAWGGKLGAAARKKTSRWASAAAGRGGELASRLMEECTARAVRSWRETIEPQTESARRRLEGVADSCMAEVAAHLADPVLAEAL